MTALSETKRYQAYPEYKDSRVEWVGSIPSHWIVTSLKRYTYVKGGFAFSSDLFGDVGKPVIRIGDIKQDGSISLESCKYVPEVVAENSQEYLVSNGQLLMAMTGATIGKAGIYSGEYPALVNQRVGRFEVYDDKLSYRFLWYVLKTLGYQEYIRLTAFGGAQPNISDTAMVAYDSAFPPLDEQTKIANFLDHETAKIDTLIEKQQQLIKLLKEKRQAVISHAVTKGLNPKAPMKNSGVEWLGEVPEHWVTKSYRYACKIYRGKFGHRPRNDPAFYDGDYPFIQTGDVARAGKMITSYSQTLNEKGKEVSQLFPAGTLMMAIAANIGDTAILGFEAYAPDSVVGFKPYADLDIEFLRYSFMAALPALEQTSTQSTQANLNVDRIGAVKAVFPTYDEQREIVEYLDRVLGQYDSIEKRCKEAIALMQERRTALISAAVTGKIDVRNWQAPTHQDQALEQTA